MLDLHSTGSTYVGDNELGHPQFETHRTDIGELLFRLKYRSDRTVISEMTSVASEFIRSRDFGPDIVVPVPPTRARGFQPVIALAFELARRLGIPIAAEAVRKTKRFAELKSVYDAEERRRLLEGTFSLKIEKIRDRRILLVDDLYRSGATMNAIAEAITAGGATAIFAFAFTQTRSRA